jgi:Carboxypeptidase regulatory-like domain
MKFILPGLLVGGALWAQTTALRGVVTDQSGAVVPNATVTLKGPGGLARTAQTGEDGAYTITGLPPGDYTADAAAPQLMLPQPEKVSLRTGLQTLNLQLKVAATSVQVVVNDQAGPLVSTEAANNAGALVLQGDDLDALSDDPDDLAADLQALAGPSAGPEADRSSSMASVAASFPQRNPSAKFGLIRTRFHPSTTSWAWDGSKF